MTQNLKFFKKLLDFEVLLEVCHRHVSDTTTNVLELVCNLWMKQSNALINLASEVPEAMTNQIAVIANSGLRLILLHRMPPSNFGTSFRSIC